MSLAYPDGSVASITYASGGHSSTPKERIEVLGGGRSAVVDDFRVVTLDGKTTKLSSQDKGHNALVTAFKHTLQTGDASATEAAIASSRTTLRAAGGAEFGDDEPQLS